VQLMEKIVIFGDSIMKGVVFNESDGRYRVSSALGVDALAGRFGLTIENRSRFGCTLEKGLGVLRRTVEREQDCRAVILEYGGNDCDFDWEQVAAEPEAEHQPHTTIERFAELYAGAIVELQRRSIVPVLTTLPPLCAERYLDWICRGGLSRENILRWLGDVNAIYRYQERYSRVVERLAERFDAPLIDLRSAFLSERKMERLFCADGIHPNELGQRVIHDAFSRFMETAAAGAY